MRRADAIELLDVRTFIKTAEFGGELFRLYERGDREDVECDAIEAETRDGLLIFRVTGKHQSRPHKSWSHDYTYGGPFLVHWSDL